MKKRFAACCVLGGCTENDASKYSAAQKSLTAGQYDTAITAFAALGEYEDSGKYVLYATALQKLAEGKFDAAIRDFSNLGDFKSSSLYAQYARAAQAEAAGNCKAAYNAYLALGSFSDSAGRADALAPLASIETLYAWQGDVAWFTNSEFPQSESGAAQEPVNNSRAIRSTPFCA